MIELLSEILNLSQLALWQAFSVFLRIGGMMAVLPAFAERSVPMRIRLGLALAFTMIVAPALPIRTMPDAASMIGLMLSEAIAGVFFGLMLRFFVLALQIAGTIAAQSTSLSQLFGGSAGTDPQPAMGHLLVISGLALATSMGLHVHMCDYMIQSYELIEFGRAISPSQLADIGVAQIAACFELGFNLAAPFVIASLAYNVTLGVINKAMPQLMVAFVGAPAITAGGLLLLLISAPIMLSIWLARFNSFMFSPFTGSP